MQQVGCITTFLCSMVATCESNENGRFSTHLGLAKPSLASLPMCAFIAQLVEHRTGIAEVKGSNPVEALIFSGFSFPIA